MRDVPLEKLAPKFWPKVEKTENCWLWTGYHGGAGYGQVLWYVGNGHYTSINAHRLSLMLHGTEVPDGWHVDHLCRVRHCVNPDHLEAVTHRQNIIRGQNPPAENARKIACNRGHDYTADSTYIDKLGKRHCMTCRKMRRAGVV